MLLKSKIKDIIWPTYISKCCNARVYPKHSPDIDPTPVCSNCHNICEVKECEHKKRCVISLYGWNFLYCPDCQKEWHDEDI